MHTISREQFLKENPYKLLFKIATPSIIGLLLSGLNIMIDAYYISIYLGEIALSAVTIVSALNLIPNLIGELIGSGSSIIIGKNIAIGNQSENKKIVNIAISLLIIFLIPIILVLYINSYNILRFLGANSLNIDLSIQFLNFLMIAFFFNTYNIIISNILTVNGKYLTPIFCNGIGLIVNIILNPIFIKQYGIIGSPIVNIISFSFSSLLLTFFSYKYFGKIILKKSLYNSYNIVKTGSASFFLQIVFITQQIVLIKQISNFNLVKEISMIGIGYTRIMPFLILPLIGLIDSFKHIFSINYLIKNRKRNYSILKSVFISSYFFILPCWLILIFYSPIVLNYFLPNTVFQVENYTNFKLLFITIPIIPFFFISIGYFQIVDKIKIAVFLLLMRQVILFYPILIFMKNLYGLNGIYLSILIIDLISFFILSLFIYKIELRNSVVLKPIN